MKKLLCLCLLLVLAGCSRTGMMESLVSDEKKQIARAYIQRFLDGDTATLIKDLDPSLRNDNIEATFKQMRALLPPGKPTAEPELVGWTSNYTVNGRAEHNLTYQFHFGTGWIVINAAWRDLPDGTRQLFGMRVQPLTDSLQELNAFTFKHATVWHYVFFAAAVVIPIFVLVTLITCIRTKIPKRKWLWVIFILLGLMNCSFNWTTGAIDWRPMAFLVFGAGAFSAGAYGAWVISVAAPVGAVMFWIQRREWRTAAATEVTPPPIAPGV
jgi:hypothetical protein